MKLRMRDRDTSRDTAELLDCPREIQLRYKDFQYDSCLKLVLWGTPYKDSRPKINTRTLGISNKNMSEMKVSFGRFYKNNPLLQKTTIMSPYHMGFRAYIAPTQKEYQYFKKVATAKERRLFEQERLGHMNIQDVDNMLKIHNDILFEPEFRILLDDAWNLGFDQPLKLLTPKKENERVEVWIYYSSKPSKFYQWKMEQNWHVKYWMWSIKHMNIHGRNISQQFIHLKQCLQKELRDCRNEAEIRQVVKKFAEFLEKEYPATFLKELADLEQSNKYNRFDSMFKLMTLLTKGNPAASAIVARGGRVG